MKGGAGRSTLSTNLAGELAKAGKTVLIDCDMPQGTSASWYAIRRSAMPTGNLLADTAASHQDLVRKVDLHQDADYLVLDCPPRIAEMSRAALLLADLALVPVGASVAEVWATSDVVELIEQANRVKPVEVRMVWTRYRAQTKLARELSAMAGEALGLKAMKAALGLRVAYPEALGEGKTVMELYDAAAKAELTELVAELQSIVR